MEHFRTQYAPHATNQFNIDLPPSAYQVKSSAKRARAKPSAPRVIIRLITLAIGACVLSVLAYSTAVWYSTRHKVTEQPGRLPQAAWPDRMTLKPTYVLLAASIIGVGVQLVALFTLVGSVSSEYLLLRWFLC
jgi:hypothetical protein